MNWPVWGPWLSSMAVVFDGTILAYFVAFLFILPIYLLYRGNRKVTVTGLLVLFGHLAEGNLHVNVLDAGDPEKVTEAVLSLVASLGGSISSEHGIGRAKARWLGLSRTEAEIDVMRSVKAAFDPLGLLNPGVLLPTVPRHNPQSER